MSAQLLLGLATGVVGAVVFGLGAVMQARAVRRPGAGTGSLVDFVSASLRSRPTLLVVAAYSVGFLLHAVSIQLLPLYLAQSVVAMSVLVAALGASRVEQGLDRTRSVAVGAVMTGLVLLAISSGHPGDPVTAGGFAVVLWVGVLALVGIARVGQGLPGGVCGALAGMGSPDRPSRCAASGTRSDSST